jgi:hypothetical protein
MNTTRQLRSPPLRAGPGAGACKEKSLRAWLTPTPTLALKGEEEN